ncbi:unnamed protein product [Schistocephalus solidus]|uniref:Secreted protein n=1 Tax=Schistocephalus solidus TaxID=70667 RepID=A0A183T988_SCHSO|nr:unnamed protein product [Schistocephalus solidus]
MVELPWRGATLTGVIIVILVAIHQKVRPCSAELVRTGARVNTVSLHIAPTPAVFLSQSHPRPLTCPGSTLNLLIISIVVETVRHKHYQTVILPVSQHPPPPPPPPPPSLHSLP